MNFQVTSSSTPPVVNSQQPKPMWMDVTLSARVSTTASSSFEEFRCEISQSEKSELNIKAILPIKTQEGDQLTSVIEALKIMTKQLEAQQALSSAFAEQNVPVKATLKNFAPQETNQRLNGLRALKAHNDSLETHIIGLNQYQRSIEKPCESDKAEIFRLRAEAEEIDERIVSISDICTRLKKDLKAMDRRLSTLDSLKNLDIATVHKQCAKQMVELEAKIISPVDDLLETYVKCKKQKVELEAKINSPVICYDIADVLETYAKCKRQMKELETKINNQVISSGIDALLDTLDTYSEYEDRLRSLQSLEKQVAAIESEIAQLNKSRESVTAYLEKQKAKRMRLKATARELREMADRLVNAKSLREFSFLRNYRDELQEVRNRIYTLQSFKVDAKAVEDQIKALEMYCNSANSI